MSYKNILWLDDEKVDNDIKNFFHDYSPQVDYVNSFHDFFKKTEIIKPSFLNYDLIVLDVNLSNLNMDDKKLFKEKIKSCITLKEDDNIDIEKSAGVFIYLYLALNRYPKERICFLTGNPKSYIHDVFESYKISAPSVQNIIEKKASKSRRSNRPTENKWKIFYNGGDTFYQMRYILRNMCIILEEWLNYIIDQKKEIIWKNKDIYYKTDCSNTHDIIEFRNMLSSVKTRLNTFKPKMQNEIIEICADIVNEVVSFAEAFATPNKKKYYSILKIVRNSLAHNQAFLKTDIDINICLFICLIGFRIYFNFESFSEYERFDEYSHSEDKILELLSGYSVTSIQENNFSNHYYSTDKAYYSAEKYFNYDCTLQNNSHPNLPLLNNIHDIYCLLFYINECLKKQNDPFFVKCLKAVADKL